MTTTPARGPASHRGFRLPAIRQLAPLAVATLLAALAASPLCAAPAATATRTPRHPLVFATAVPKDRKPKKGSKAQAGPATHATQKPPAQARSLKGSSKAHGHATRPAPVNDPPPPFTVYQARNRRTGLHEPPAHETRTAEARVEHPARPAWSRPAPAPAVAHADPPRPPAPASGADSAVTTSDFLRAAGGSPQAVPPATASSPAFYASGQSQPDDDETLPRSQGAHLDTATGEASPAHNAQPAMTAAARPARSAAPPQSVVLIAPLHAEASVTRPRADLNPQVTARADAQPPAPTHSTVVASGFGPEVDIATDGPPVKSAASRRSKPAPPAIVARNTPPPVSSLPVAERDAITDAAMRPVVLPTVYSRNGRVLLPAPLKGSREVLVHQNTMADADGLERIESESQLNEMRAAGVIVAFPETAALHVNDELPWSHRAARPWTVRFASDAAKHFYDRFRQPLIVTSAVRTIDYQVRLERVNGNAAGIEGETASPHLTGQALDIAKGRMNAAELAWMRAYLLPLMRAGLIDVEEEFQQSCFHISVYRRYAPTPRHAARPTLKAEARAFRGTTGSDEDEER